MKQYKIIQFLLIIVVLLMPTLIHAQGPDFIDDTNDAPVDGGLSLLIAGGVGYGIKKAKELKAKNKKHEMSQNKS